MTAFKIGLELREKFCFVQLVQKDILSQGAIWLRTSMVKIENHSRALYVNFKS